MENNKRKNLWILLGVVVVIVIIIILVASNNKQEMQAPGDQPGEQTSGEEGTPPADEDVIAGEEGEDVEINPVLKDARTEVPGASLITTDNKVVTREGTPTRNDVTPMTPEAPQQTGPVSKEALSEEVVKLDVTSAGWTPAEFSVDAGAAVTLSVSSADNYTHVFKFDDPSLSAVAVGVGPSETRAITFNAPETEGEYTFRCDVPGHAGRGEVGKMIVE